MFGNQASGHVRAVTSSRGTDERTAHLARRQSWERDAHKRKVRAVMSGALREAVRPVRRPSVSLLVPTARPGRLEHIYQTIATQQDVQVQLVVLTRGFAPADAYWRRLARDHGIDDVVYLYLPADVPLGDCYNYCVRSADGDVVAMIDDEDHYGPHYLSDQLYSLQYSNADIVGKQAHYMYLEELDTTLLRFDDRELRFSDVVTVPTLVGGREALTANPLPPFGTNEGTFTWSAGARGLKVYSADKFNYFQIRLAVGSTEQLPDTKLLTSGRFQFFGRPEPRIDI